MDVGWMDGCLMDVGWLEKAELKPTQPSLAGAWLSLAKTSSPTSFQICRTEQIFGHTMKYVSHIEEVQGFNQAYFSHGNEMLYQDDENNIFQSSFGVHERVSHIFYGSPYLPVPLLATY